MGADFNYNGFKNKEENPLSVVGGNECMGRLYKEICKEYRCTAKVFAKPVGVLKNKLGKPDLMIFFTGTMSHKMLQGAQ